MRRILKYSAVLPGILIGFLLIVAMPPPDPLFDTGYSTVLNSREGELLSARIAPDEQWRFPPATELPEKYKIALLNYEDRYFYQHPGINPVSLGRALLMNIRAGRIVSGGSTITMQLARMVRGNQERTLWNKLQETLLALRFELYLEKEEILKYYVSHAPFGGNVVGLNAASWRYYGRPADQLSWAEAVNLAVLPNAPGLVFPGTNDEQLRLKRDRLLKTIFDQGLLSELDYKLAIEEELPGKPHILPDQAPHLINRIIAETGGEKNITSTLDQAIQESVNEIVNNYYDKIKHQEVHNAAVLVTHIETGEILAYVGNTRLDARLDHGTEVDIISSKRSPGSLLKPVLYALALDEGLMGPDQLLPDVPLYYQGFVPQNFDKKYQGAVAASSALQSSLNIPFVNLLADYGYEKMHTKLSKLGMSSLDKDPGHYGLTIILGGGEVSLWDINKVYSGMARTLFRYNNTKGQNRYLGDEYDKASYILKENHVISPDQEQGVISAGAIWLTFKAMEDLVRPGMRLNWKNYASAKAISWKTGTSWGHKDAWAVGINSEYVVGVWLGNADGEGRPDLVGSQIAAPLMFDVFEGLPLANENRTAPIADLHMDEICIQSGHRAGPFCRQSESRFLPNSVEESPVCPYHKNIYLDKNKDWQVNSSCYPVQDMVQESWFVLPAAQSWYFRKSNPSYVEPPEFKPDCRSNNERMMELIYPKTNTRIYIPTEIDGNPGKVVFEAAHQNPSVPIYWHLDQEFVGSTKTVHQMGFHPPKGMHTLSLLDADGHELSVQFEVLN